MGRSRAKKEPGVLAVECVVLLNSDLVTACFHLPSLPFLPLSLTTKFSLSPLGNTQLWVEDNLPQGLQYPWERDARTRTHTHI